MLIKPKSSIFPVDLTPGQRASLKLYSHFAIIAVFNAGLAAIAYLTQNRVIDWQTIILCVISQGVLALLDALKKYYSASGQLPLSTLFDLARQEVAAKAPPAPVYDPTEQVLKQAVNTAVVNDILQPTTVMQPVIPTVAAPVYPEVPPDVKTVNTLPNIAAVNLAKDS